MANYYPIKCPYCLKTHTNNTVSFNLDSAIITERTVRRPVERYVEDIAKRDEAQYFDRSNWDVESTNSQTEFLPGRGDSQNIADSGNFTLSELRARYGEANVRPDWKTVIAIPALTNGDCYGDLLTGVTVTTQRDGKTRELTMRDRYCDCDDGHKLNEFSGSVPSYVVLLMGSSNSGKTMYLISLYHALSQSARFTIPPSADQSRVIASLWMNVLNEGAMDDIAGTGIEKMTEDLFEHSILPITTTYLFNEPLTMEVTIRFNKSRLENKALLFLRDMPGEFLSSARRMELARISNQFPKFDGFMIMFDPMTFDKPIFGGENNENSKLWRTQTNQLRQVISTSIVPTMEGNSIKQPTAAIITKGDLFFNRYHRDVLRNHGISFAMPLLVPTQLESFDRPYFDEVDSGARDIVRKLSESISELIDEHFDDAFFSLLSSLSSRPIDISTNSEGRKIVTARNAIKPWHVTDPMLRLLMKLNIIPPLDQIVARAPDREPPDERNARTFKNRTLLNKWGAKYCSGGSNESIV